MNIEGQKRRWLAIHFTETIHSAIEREKGNQPIAQTKIINRNNMRTWACVSVELLRERTQAFIWYA